MKKSVCFTGHRQITVTAELHSRINTILTELIHDGAADFYAGGALGWDMFCENAVLNIKEEFPHIRLNLILPCPPEIQTAKWSEEQKQEFNRIFNAADSREILSDFYYDGCMKKRNQRLVDLSEICVCYCTNLRSGTGQTVRMAQNKNLTVINIADKN